MGPVQNGPDLNQVINASKINLNINPVLSFHNKVPEVAGAGAFFLTRQIGVYDLFPIERVFEPNKEIVLFQDEHDLLEKVRYYLSHPGERETIALRARKKMLNQFTFRKGAQKMLADIVVDVQKREAL